MRSTSRTDEPRRLIDRPASGPPVGAPRPAGDPPTGELPADVVDAKSTAGWAISLLRSTPPYQSPAGRKQRVLLGLGRQDARGRSASLRTVLRPAIALGVLLGFGAIASAALGHLPAWAERAYDRLLGRPVGSGPERSTPSARSVREVPAPPAPSFFAQPPTTQPPTTQPPTTQPPTTAAVGARSVSRPASRDDHAPVLEAMRALRVQRDPGRARALLAGYLARHPDGALAEEALALSIEAAVAQEDPDAGTLARRYLRSYPNGAFQTLARQAAMTAGPPRL